MALIVHKYGGTSMGSPERILNVARRVTKWARTGHQMVVVPSAMPRLRLVASKPESVTAKAAYYAVIPVAGPNMLIEKAAQALKTKACSKVAFWLAAAVAAAPATVLEQVVCDIEVKPGFAMNC